MLAVFLILAGAALVMVNGQGQSAAIAREQGGLQDAAQLLADGINGAVLAESGSFSKTVFLPDGNYELKVSGRRVSALRTGGETTVEYSAPILTDLVVVKGTIAPGTSVSIKRSGNTVTISKA